MKIKGIKYWLILFLCVPETTYYIACIYSGAYLFAYLVVILWKCLPELDSLETNCVVCKGSLLWSWYKFWFIWVCLRGIDIAILLLALLLMLLLLQLLRAVSVVVVVVEDVLDWIAVGKYDWYVVVFEECFLGIGILLVTCCCCCCCCDCTCLLDVVDANVLIGDDIVVTTVGADIVGICVASLFLRLLNGLEILFKKKNTFC